jgi:hypothetical protein
MHYFHGSDRLLSIGTILRPQPGYVERWGHTPFYQVLETYRPPRMLAHHEAVFMCDNEDDIDCAGGATDYIYVVKPMGKVTRHDLNWSSQIDCDFSDGAGKNELGLLALHYWGGQPHENESVWEYLTPSAIIVGIVQQ